MRQNRTYPEHIDMRQEKAANLLILARKLASSTEGLTISDVMDEFSVGRRTAERMRDAVEAVFGPLQIMQEGSSKRFRIDTCGLNRLFTSLTYEELTELENASNALLKQGDAHRSGLLRSLHEKIDVSLKSNDKRRLDVDVDVLVSSEVFASSAGPKPYAEPTIISSIRRAILEQRQISFDYKGSGPNKKKRVVIPYGLLFSNKYYLIGGAEKKNEPIHFRLDKISNMTVGIESGRAPDGFNLGEYMRDAFSVFKEQPEDIEVIFKKSVAEDASSYIFHPSQKLTKLTNGSLRVCFRAGGLLEMVNHFLTWGDGVKIVKPQRLCDLMKEQVALLHRHHCS